MKRTAKRLSYHGNFGWCTNEKITCEVTAESVCRSKIWVDVNTGKHYYLIKQGGQFYFKPTIYL